MPFDYVRDKVLKLDLEDPEVRSKITQKQANKMIASLLEAYDQAAKAKSVLRYVGMSKSDLAAVRLYLRTMNKQLHALQELRSSMPGPTAYEDLSTEQKEAIQNRVQIRQQLADRDGYKCHYCRCSLTRAKGGKPLSGRNKTIDHKIPKCLGGTDDLENLVLACYTCNIERGHTPYEEFLAKKQAAVMPSPISTALHAIATG